jgi:CubicO group peptidase (beta-lactamase class C family)
VAGAVDLRVVHDVVAYYGSLLDFSRRYLRIPGVQAAVYAGGEVVWSGAYGMADVEAGVGLTDQHLFRIASHSKTVTATAVLQLAERGLLRLDDRAAAHILDLAGLPLGEVTVRELLGHTAGVVRDGADGDFWVLAHSFPDRDALLKVLREEGSAVLPPNERFKYSNIGFGMLGMIVEAAAGMSYAEYVRKHIAGPLGLSDFGPEFDPERGGDYATGYSSLAYATARVPIEHIDTRALAPATGCYASAIDLVRYFAAHLPDDDRLLADASKRMMRHAAWQTKADDADQRYGLGFSVQRIGGRDWFGHGGGFPGFITRTLVDAERALVVTVLTNAIDGPAVQLASSFAKLLDLALESSGSTDGRQFTGRYANVWGVADLVQFNGRLFLLDPSLTDPAGEAIELEPVDDHTLRWLGANGYGSYGEPFTFEFDAHGNVASMHGPSSNTRVLLTSFSLPDRVTVRRTQIT